MTSRFSRWSWIPVLLLLAAAWVFLQFKVPYQVGFKEQMGVFIASPEMLSHYLSKPAMLSEFLGDYLTQYFYLDFGGPLIISFCLLLLWLGLTVSLKKLGCGDASAYMAFLPVIIEFYCVIWLNYVFSMTIGLILSVWIFVACSGIKSEKTLLAVFAVMMPITYLLAGAHMVTMLVLMLMLRRRNILPAIVVAISGLLMELVIGRLLGLDASQTFVYPLIMRYTMPSVITLVSLPCSIILFTVLARFNVRPIVFLLVDMAALPFAMWRVYLPENEFNVEIATHAYRNEWDKVKEMAIENPSNGEIGIFYRNLCFARENALAENLMKYYQTPYGGLQFAVQPGTGYLPIFCAIDGLLEVGDISQANDCALLCHTVMPRNDSSRMLRKLAEIAIIQEDYAVAQKYLRMLSKTRFHKAWAKDISDHLKNGEIPGQLMLYRLSAPHTDAFFHQNNWMESLALVVKLNEENKTALDYLLCSHLLGKNVNSFVGLYEKYYMPRYADKMPVPDVYQEALLSSVQSPDEYYEVCRKYNISDSIANNWMQFSLALTDHDQTRLNQFKETYWYYLTTTKIVVPEK